MAANENNHQNHRNHNPLPPGDENLTDEVVPENGAEPENELAPVSPPQETRQCPLCQGALIETDFVCQDCLKELEEFVLDSPESEQSLLEQYSRIFDRSITDTNEIQLIQLFRILFDHLKIPETISDEHPLELTPIGEQLLNLTATTLAEFETATGRLMANPYPYLRMGIGLILMRDSESASFFLDRTIHLDPSLSEVWYAKGLVLDRSGRFQEALRCFDRAIQNKAEHYQAYFRKGMIYDELGRFREALRSYDKVLKINNNYAPAWRRKGDILQQQQQYKKSQECYLKADAICGETTEAEVTPTDKPVPLPLQLDQILTIFPQAQRERITKETEKVERWKNLGIGLGLDTSRLQEVLSNLPSVLMSPGVDIDHTLETLGAYADDLRDQINEKVVKALYELTEQINEAKRLVDSTPAEEWLENAQSAHREERYKDALDFVQRAHEELDASQQLYDKAVTAIQSAWSKLVDARAKTVDTSMGEKLLGHARTAMRKGEFEKVFNLTENALAVTFVPQSTLAKQIQEALDAIDGTIKNLRESGVDVEEAVTLYHQAHRAFEAEDYNTAEQLISDTKSAIKHTRQAFNLQFITDRAAELETAINELKSDGADVSALETQLTLLRSYLDEQNFGKSFEYLDLLEASVATERKQFIRQNLKYRIEQTFDLISDAESFGADVVAMRDNLMKASKCIRNDNLDEANEIINEVEGKVPELRLEYFTRNSPLIISELGRELRRFKKLEVDTEALAEKFSALKSMINTGDFNTAITAYKALEQRFKEMFEWFYLDRTKTALEKINKKMSEFEKYDPSETDVDLTEVQSLKDQADTYFKQREYESAYECATRADELIQTVVETFNRYKQETEEILNIAREALQSIPSDHTAMAKGKRMFEKAQLAASKHKYKTAVKLARGSVAEIKGAARHIKIVDRLHSLRSIMSRMKDMGIDITEAKQEFDKARQHLVKHEYKPIFEIIKTTKNLVIKRQQEANKIREANEQGLKQLRAIMTEAAALGAEIEKLSQKVLKLELVNKTNPYRDIQPFLTKCIKESVRIRDRRKAISELMAARKMIDAIECKGYDSRSASVILQQARKPLLKHEYAKATTLAQKTIAESATIERIITIEDQLRASLLHGYIEGKPHESLEKLEQILEESQQLFHKDTSTTANLLDKASAQYSPVSGDNVGELR